jgi:GxxExxY protein
MSNLILKEESYELIGICMEVHRELGMGFREIIYKDALEYEFKQKRFCMKEREATKFCIKLLFSHGVIMLTLLFMTQLFLK